MTIYAEVNTLLPPCAYRARMPEKRKKPGSRKGQSKPLRRVLDPGFQARLKEAIGDQAVPSVALRAGCERATIHNYLNGKNRQIEALLLFDLADSLHVSAKWLAKGVGGKRGLLHDEARLLDSYRKASADEKELILRLLDKMGGEQTGE